MGAHGDVYGGKDGLWVRLRRGLIASFSRGAVKKHNVGGEGDDDAED